MEEDLLQSAIEKTTMGIFMIKDAADNEAHDVGIVLERVTVLQDLDSVAFATSMLFGLMYSLNLQYSTKLHFTFEILQNSSWSWMEGNSLSRPNISNLNSTSEMDRFWKDCWDYKWSTPEKFQQPSCKTPL